MLFNIGMELLGEFIQWDQELYANHMPTTISPFLYLFVRQEFIPLSIKFDLIIISYMKMNPWD